MGKGLGENLFLLDEGQGGAYRLKFKQNWCDVTNLN